MKEKKAKAENDKKNTSLRKHRSILDAVLFFIIVLALSSAMIIISSTIEESNEYYLRYDRSDEYIENSMHTILCSTVPRAAYQDLNGQKTEYVGHSVEQLIITDLAIRNANHGEINFSSLENGIEDELSEKFDFLIADDRNFIITCGYQKAAVVDRYNISALFISNMNEPPELEESSSPDHEFHLAIPMKTSTGPSTTGSEVVFIRLYFV